MSSRRAPLFRAGKNIASWLAVTDAIGKLSSADAEQHNGPSIVVQKAAAHTVIEAGFSGGSINHSIESGPTVVAVQQLTYGGGDTAIFGFPSFAISRGLKGNPTNQRNETGRDA